MAIFNMAIFNMAIFNMAKSAKCNIKLTECLWIILRSFYLLNRFYSPPT